MGAFVSLGSARVPGERLSGAMEVTLWLARCPPAPTPPIPRGPRARPFSRRLGLRSTGRSAASPLRARRKLGHARTAWLAPRAREAHGYMDTFRILDIFSIRIRILQTPGIQYTDTVCGYCTLLTTQSRT